ncbi:ATP-binding protein [Nitratiruptor sp. YY09-18]|uniref:ATP-binding protein n=1 Tax=Nitratiruptor sp. YY09-18 TaxID=2724901 RepID=UPI0019153F65|nr:ATP-binding protein [Nitratiruptor sp. YY09-18]BCD68671.1 hypothetical protein NitYY0918_C1588 [Nitratiruptor sp. YY09-18]
MADFKAIAKIFEDRVEGIELYQTRSFLQTKNQLLDILENETRQMLFLVGAPGCGKSVFLENLSSLLENRYEVIKYNTPFFEPVDFVRNLLQKKSIDAAANSLEELLEQLIKEYENSQTLIAIDEAQLLTKDMIELIRILADSKAFWFLLAMHKHESSKILQEPQFSSRPHRVLEMGLMQPNEVQEYIHKELLREGEYILEQKISNDLAKYIYKLTKGNFRDTKKLLNRMFLLMDAALSLDKKGYDKPNKCLVTMAAMDGGLID